MMPKPQGMIKIVVQFFFIAYSQFRMPPMIVIAELQWFDPLTYTRRISAFFKSLLDELDNLIN